ncbi:AAA family ATPase [Agitococcus lubricus]|uniref:ATPase family protein associated with various cellular activities (AAA) n=1 Tax=Agitococcus lubricus TaxID=1077255 RepID=A0A2T5ISI8_9GAMM|nr:AAA family ATPase [Agitococcus lubricus]PTQ86792.1 ATPase family protein associated with various cellular activities (AAA) [Agitococcus lubricus]
MPINPFKNKTTKPTARPNGVGQAEADKYEKKQSMEAIEATEPAFVLDDLILPSETMSQLLDFLSYKDCEQQVFSTWGLAATHSYGKQTIVNFYGEPGTGKTMAAHAVAAYLHKPLIVVNYADVESKYVGETSKNICNIFRVAKEKEAIIFFDEADAILSRRVNNMSHATDVVIIPKNNRFQK